MSETAIQRRTVEPPHVVLGVPEGSSYDVYNKAYKKLAIENHPDKTGDDGEKMKVINKAWDAVKITSRSEPEPHTVDVRSDAQRPHESPSSGQRPRQAHKRPKFAETFRGSNLGFETPGEPDFATTTRLQSDFVSLFDRLSASARSTRSSRPNTKEQAFDLAARLATHLDTKLGAGLDTVNADDFRPHGKLAAVVDEIANGVDDLVGVGTYRAKDIATYALLLAAEHRQEAAARNGDRAAQRRVQRLETERWMKGSSLSYTEVPRSEIPLDFAVTPITPLRKSATQFAKDESQKLLADSSLTKRLQVADRYSFGFGGSLSKDVTARIEVVASEYNIPTYQAGKLMERAFAEAAREAQKAASARAGEGNIDFRDSLRMRGLDDFLDHQLGLDFDVETLSDNITPARDVPSAERTYVDMAQELFAPQPIDRSRERSTLGL